MALRKLICLEQNFQLKETRISSVMTEPQRALYGYISAGQEIITRAEEELLTRVIEICY